MTLSEPQFIPVMYPIRTVAWYCVTCGFCADAEYQIVAHSKVAHKAESPMNGVEYVIGAQVVRMLQRRDEWIDITAERFRNQLDSLRGADDLILEAGDLPPGA